MSSFQSRKSDRTALGVHIVFYRDLEERWGCHLSTKHFLEWGGGPFLHFMTSPEGNGIHSADEETKAH